MKCERVEYPAPDCPNCGQKDEGNKLGARMSSTTWGHNYSCCSDACGRRLAKRLETGMITRDQIGQDQCPTPFIAYANYINSDTIKERRLRIRIKQLEHRQLKAAYMKGRLDEAKETSALLRSLLDDVKGG